MPIRFEAWPIRPTGGQRVGPGPSGVRGTHWSADEMPTGIEAICELHRSQHKNKIVVQEMIEWALASAGIKETPNDQ